MKAYLITTLAAASAIALSSCRQDDGVDTTTPETTDPHTTPADPHTTPTTPTTPPPTTTPGTAPGTTTPGTTTPGTTTPGTGTQGGVQVPEEEY